MPDDLPVRYYNSAPKHSRFQQGDVLFTYSDRSVKKLFRLIVDTDHGGDNYHTYRLDDQGNRTGPVYDLKPEQVKHFHKDTLLTNLIAQKTLEVDHV